MNSSGTYGVLKVMFVAVAGALLHDLRGAELVAAVHDRQVVRELGDEDRVLHRRVAAADDRDVLALEEGAVADAAGGDALAAELQLAGDAEALRLGAHREDDAARAVLVVAHPDGLDAAVGELDPGGVVGDEAGAEPLRLLAELLHQLRAHDPLGESRVVLHVGGVLELPAPLEPLDDQGLELGTGGVGRRRVPGGRPTDDDHVLDSAVVVHIHSVFLAATPFRGKPL